MTTGSGFCPHCGIAIEASWKTFCGSCGGKLLPPKTAAEPKAAPKAAAASKADAAAADASTAATAAPASAPAPVVAPAPVAAPAPAWPSAAPVAPAPAPAAWGAQPPVAQQQAWQGYGPGAPAKAKTNPLIFIIGGVLILALIGAIAFVAVMATSGGGSNVGGITVSPSSYKCSSGNPVQYTVKLPSSVKGTDQVTNRVDGGDWGRAVTVSDQFTQQSDGTWLHDSASDPLSTCAGPNGTLSTGSHKVQVVDSSGKVLADGSFTITP